MDNQSDAIIAETLRGLHMEINALRTANEGLMEKVRRLEEAGDRIYKEYKRGNYYDELVDAWETAKGQP